MRILILLLVLLAPVAAATSLCTSQGCAHVRDLDRDGVPDWAIVSLTAEQTVAAGIVVENRTAHHQSALTMEESLDEYAAMRHEGRISSGDPWADLYVEAYTGDEETGMTDDVAWAYLALAPADEDGEPAAWTLVVVPPVLP